MCVGLFLGAPFVLLGVSGSLLVFYNELDRVLNPAIRVVQVPVHSPSMAAVQQQLHQAYPAREGAWRVEMPLTEESPLTARYYRPEERRGHFFAPLMLTLDPATLEISSRRFWGDYFATWVYDLHYSLLLQSGGRMIVGWLGVLMMLSLLSGLYLWWPSPRKFLPALRPKLRGGVVRKTYDLHVTLGVYGGSILFLLCLTGVALAWPETTRAVLGVPPPPIAPAAAENGQTGAAVLGIDEALALARRRFPQAELRWVELPARTGHVLSVRLHQAQEPGRRFPKTQIWIDLRRGDVLAVHDPLAAATGDRVLSWMHPIHNAEAFGWWGRVIACVCGAVPLVLLVTGWMRWRHKKRARATACQRPRGRAVND